MRRQWIEGKLKQAISVMGLQYQSTHPIWERKGKLCGDRGKALVKAKRGRRSGNNVCMDDLVAFWGEIFEMEYIPMWNYG